MNVSPAVRPCYLPQSDAANISVIDDIGLPVCGRSGQDNGKSRFPHIPVVGLSATNFLGTTWLGIAQLNFLCTIDL